MNLIVDVGNTRVKLALFEQGRLTRQCGAGILSAAALEGLLGGRRADRAVISSTRGPVPGIVELVRRFAYRVLEFTAATPVPIGNAYLTPATLGARPVGRCRRCRRPLPGTQCADRRSGYGRDDRPAVGRRRLPGGCISPGMSMRFRALHDYTASLPLCDATDSERAVGRTTDEAIRLGVMNSIAFEIEGYVARLGGNLRICA